MAYNRLRHSPFLAVKIPVRDGEAQVADYSVTDLGSNAIKYGSTKYITAVLDNDKFVNEYIDGYEASALPDNLVADRLDSAGYSLALTEDTDALDTLAKGVKGKDKAGVAFAAGDVRQGKTGTKVAPTASVYADAVSCMIALDNAKVPQEGRYMIVTPEFYGKLLKDTTNFIRQSNLSQELVMSGAIGMIAGFAVYKSNVLASVDAGIDAICGHPLFATRIEAWKKEPFVCDINGDMNVVGGSAIKGRMVFTHEVTKPQAFAYIGE